MLVVSCACVCTLMCILLSGLLHPPPSVSQTFLKQNSCVLKLLLLLRGRVRREEGALWRCRGSERCDVVFGCIQGPSPRCRTGASDVCVIFKAVVNVFFFFLFWWHLCGAIVRLNYPPPHHHHHLWACLCTTLQLMNNQTKHRHRFTEKKEL